MNARELHAFLGVGKDFSNWIKDRIATFGFTAGADYLLAEIGEQLPSGMKYRKDYTLTLDMAKELSMVERTEKGKQAPGEAGRGTIVRTFRPRSPAFAVPRPVVTLPFPNLNGKLQCNTTFCESAM